MANLIIASSESEHRVPRFPPGFRSTLGRGTRLTTLLLPTLLLAQDSASVPDTPAPRGFTQLVYHPPTGRVILFGGEGIPRGSLNDTWSYDARADRWQRLTPVGAPAPTHGGGATAAAWDSESDRIIAYISTELSSTVPGGLVRRSETWALDPSTGEWTDMRPDPAPFGLMGARMVYDATADRMVLFGGADFTAEGRPRFSDTWAYDFNTNSWSQRNPAHPPPGRSYFGMAYDTRAQRSLIFGGSLAEGEQARSGEMWSYDYRADAWTEVPYTGAVPPDHHPDMTYAAALDRTLYQVGEALWSFDHRARHWTELTYDSAMGVRHFVGLAFDERANRLMLFGGGPRGLRYDDQTWIYDPALDAWQRRAAGP